MPDGSDRIMEEHPGTGIAHHFPDSFPHIGFIAVYRTLFAGSLVFAELAMVQPLVTIIGQGLTLLT